MIEVNRSYFSLITKMINQVSYHKSTYQTYNPLKLESIDLSGNPNLVMQKLNRDGHCILRIDRYILSDKYIELGLNLSKILGVDFFNNNFKDGAYTQIKFEKSGKYFINSNYAQPIHTDEGYTLVCPRYVALCCVKSSKIGGDNIVVPFENLYHSLMLEFGSKTELLFHKHAIIVQNVNGVEHKPIFIRLKNNDIGISYSPVLQKMWCSKEVFKMFDFITQYLHVPSHQLRYKLHENQLILIDNCKMLHGRTAFPKTSDRLFYRYWFGRISL